MPDEPRSPRVVPGSPDARPSPGGDAGEEDFGAMLEGAVAARAFEEGETVEGTVVAIGPEVAFLDIGGKSEATIEIEELRDPEGNIEVEVGDRVVGIVVSTEGGLRLSRRLARGAAARQQIADAFRAGLPAEGRVERAIKGGYEVRVGGQRAFCPISQIDLVRTEDPGIHEGKVYVFRIMEYGDGGKNLVVSRRAILKEEEQEKAAATRKTIVPGAVLPGRVVSVREYGAFVDLGGIQGLLHVSEMAWGRVGNPAEVVRPGEEITVKVLRIDEDKGKISLGLKQLLPDPWSGVTETYGVGQVHEGRIVRLEDFGAFVELEPGVEGMAHASTFAPTGTPDGWKKSVPPGTTGMFEVLTLDPERKRIGVAMVEEGSTRAAAAHGIEAREGGGKTEIVPGARLRGKVERHERYGVFVFLAPGRTGLVPLEETATARGADLRKEFPIGSEMQVQVLEVEESGRRIRLSRRAVFEAEEKAQVREFTRQEGEVSFGSLGDKLRAALDRKKS